MQTQGQDRLKLLTDVALKRQQYLEFMKQGGAAMANNRGREAELAYQQALALIPGDAQAHKI